MHVSGDTPESQDFLEHLLRLPPKARLITGIFFFAGGTAGTIALWGRGVISGLILLLVVTGFLLTLSGISGLFRERKRRALAASVEEHREEILGAMIGAKRQGRNPVRFLNEKGIHDAGMRTALIEEMNQRLKG